MVDTEMARFVVGIEKPTKNGNEVHVELLGPDEDVLMAYYDDTTIELEKSDTDVLKDLKDVTQSFYEQKTHSASIESVNESNEELQVTVTINKNSHTVEFVELYIN